MQSYSQMSREVLARRMGVRHNDTDTQEHAYRTEKDVAQRKGLEEDKESDESEQSCDARETETYGRIDPAISPYSSFHRISRYPSCDQFIYPQDEGKSTESCAECKQESF